MQCKCLIIVLNIVWFIILNDDIIIIILIIHKTDNECNYYYEILNIASLKANID